SALRGSVGVTVHRVRGDHRGVAEYRFEGGLRVIAKMYADRAKGQAVHAIQSAVWENGFDSGSRYRVPESIGYVPEHGIMLMHAAPGESLRDVPLANWDRFKEGVLEAARWLAALHRWPHAAGPVAEAADDFSRLQRLERDAAACRPDEADRFRAALDELGRRYDSIGTSSARVQTHGRYHIDHVFLSSECVTVVDLDRAAISEAARDVGEFLHRLRWEVARMRLGKPAMHQATEEFLTEYARHTDDGLSGLLYHWSGSILSALLASACRPRPAGRHGNKRLRHLTKEFERVPRHIEALFERPKRT
ncbi:MAG TPA: phosphotransferase, partial [Actinomycetota bacterium]|nr:phosphotransferase [Actinomycetota bacterium]